MASIIPTSLVTDHEQFRQSVAIALCYTGAQGRNGQKYLVRRIQYLSQGSALGNRPFSLRTNSHVSSHLTFTSAEANLNNRLVIKGTMLLGYYCDQRDYVTRILLFEVTSVLILLSVFTHRQNEVMKKILKKVHQGTSFN